MHERFSDRARRALALANREATTLGHHHIGPEHLLLGLLTERQSVGASVLEHLDVDAETLRAEMTRTFTSGGDTSVGRRPHSPEMKEVMDHALCEARKLGHKYVGTEHLLLGLVRRQDSTVAHVLRQQGVRVESLREEVLALLRAGAEGTDEAARLEHGAFEWVHQEELAKAFHSTAFWHTMILAVDSANRLGTGEVLPEHLLLALLRDPDGPVTRLLARKGVTIDWVREQITQAPSA
jgi:ATP-dependent Clp protease ATP-binding subunit ClpA